MRISLSAYVFTLREEGRIVHVCQPLRDPQLQTRDVLLGRALSKLANKLRKAINGFIKEGKVHRIQPWLDNPECKARVEKFDLVLRDRTLKFKALLVSAPAFDRQVVFSPSLPEVVFEVENLSELHDRSTEAYSEWAQQLIAAKENPIVPEAIDMWLETLEVTVDVDVKAKKSKNIFAALFGTEKMSGSEELYKVGKCMDELVNDFDTVLGRESFVDEVDRMLQRDDRQGVLVVGQRAAGKTAIIQECVRRRARRFRDKRGHKPQVWWLSPQRLISGMSYLGQWEQRWLAILREATKRDHILYFDDLVGLFTAGRTRDSSLTAADVLRGYLAENRVRILAEATDEQLAILRRRSRALADQMHLVNVPSLSADDTLPVLIESTFDLEAKSNCYFHPETMPMVLRSQEIFSPDRAFPGKAIDMVKTLAKNISDQNAGANAITPYNFQHFGAGSLNVNLQLLKRLGGVENIQSLLRNHLIGQPAAVEALSKVVIRFSQQLQPTDRPLGVLLFLGPTGVGKTESAKALTKLLYHDETNLVRIDMNELTSAYAAEQLVGTFDQPEGRLTSAVRRQPHCVILLDEIEKAHPDVFDYLLQVIGEGRLTDARGRIADFRSTIIIMTSNLGASEQSRSLGFDVSPDRRAQIYRKAAQSFFRPEFINRLDDIVAFRNLDRNDMEQIVRLQIGEVLNRDGLNRREAFVDVTDTAVKKVIQSGFDGQLGARAIRRKLEQEIIGPLGDCLAALPSEEPVLVHIAQEDTVPSASLACHVTDLKRLPTRVPSLPSNPDEVLAIGDRLIERHTEKLNELRPQLKEDDREAGEKVEDASYYVLREQIYSCAEKLKLLKQQQALKDEPRLDGASSPSYRPRRFADHAAARRELIDWTSQEDLRNEVQESKLEQDPRETRLAQSIREVVAAFSATQAILDSALEPRNWVFGVQALTESSDEHVAVIERKTLLELFVPQGSYSDLLFVSRLARTLHHDWQYEVGTEHLPKRFWRASGVGLSGLLKPLLGTYRFGAASLPNQLGVFRAMAVPHDATQVQMQVTILSDRIRDESGKLCRFENHPYPPNVIRGMVSEELIDFASGSKINVELRNWMAFDKELSQWTQWWTHCLPLPKEFLSETNGGL